MPAKRPPEFARVVGFEDVEACGADLVADLFAMADEMLLRRDVGASPFESERRSAATVGRLARRISQRVGITHWTLGFGDPCCFRARPRFGRLDHAIQERFASADPAGALACVVASGPSSPATTPSGGTPSSAGVPGWGLAVEPSEVEPTFLAGYRWAPARTIFAVDSGYMVRFVGHAHGLAMKARHPLIRDELVLACRRLGVDDF